MNDVVAEYAKVTVPRVHADESVDFTLKAGDLASYDAFLSGMVPCKVLEITPDGDEKVARVRVTADRGAYKRGEILHLRCTQNLVHRDQVHIAHRRIMIHGRVQHLVG